MLLHPCECNIQFTSTEPEGHSCIASDCSAFEELRVQEKLVCVFHCLLNVLSRKIHAGRQTQDKQLKDHLEFQIAGQLGECTLYNA